jgi:cellulose synthase/poly-beta-1,6-N-acetylglucosamine synthase-like glycosyltransferase
VAAARGVTIPGRPGDVYDTHALTEDNELTIALKSLGALMVSPAPCTVVTELMPSWTALWRQRMRWQRGAVENIGAYGLTPATARYWGQQIAIGYGTIAIYAFMLLMLITILAVDEWVWFPFWIGIGAIFVLERVVTAWRGGWRARILAATLFPELAYDMYLSAVFVKGLFDITFGRVARWGHVNRGRAALRAEAE